MITLDEARTIVRETLAEARARSLKPLTVVVLDAGGHVVAAEREDGASPGRFAIAEAKAYGAVMLGMGGRAQMERAEGQAYFMAAVNGVFGGRVLPVPGGVLARGADGAVRGAVGATGDTSDNDAAAVAKGLEAAGLSPEI